MTFSQLKVRCETAGVILIQQRIPFTRNGVDIQIFAPKGKQFGSSVHSLVTHWTTMPSMARWAALSRLQDALPLEDCPTDCVCKDPQYRPVPEAHYGPPYEGDAPRGSALLCRKERIIEALEKLTTAAQHRPPGRRGLNAMPGAATHRQHSAELVV
jgi:hypothetical protein